MEPAAEHMIDYLTFDKREFWQQLSIEISAGIAGLFISVRHVPALDFINSFHDLRIAVKRRQRGKNSDNMP